MELLLPLSGVEARLVDLDGDISYLCDHLPDTSDVGLRSGCASGLGSSLIGQAAVRVGARDYVAPGERPMMDYLDVTRTHIGMCMQLGQSSKWCVITFLDVLRDFAGPLDWDTPGFIDAVCGGGPDLERACREWRDKRAAIDVENQCRLASAACELSTRVVALPRFGR